MSLKLAVYGYETDAGKQFIDLLGNEVLLCEDFFPLSPWKDEFDAVEVGDSSYKNTFVDDFDFSKADVVFFFTTEDESARLTDKARNAGCIVVDASRLHAGDQKVALIAPEINPFDIDKAIESRLIMPPDAVSLLLALSLSPLQDDFGIARVTATVLASVSEHGRVGTEALLRDTRMLLNGKGSDHGDFAAQLAFNVHPQIGKIEEGGLTSLEDSVEKEVMSLLCKFPRGMDTVCMLVPSFFGHTASISVELENKATLEEARESFEDCEWITLKNDENIVTPAEDVIDEQNILVSRLRQRGISGKNLSFVAMIDNARRGEAGCCLEIAKLIDKKIK